MSDVSAARERGVCCTIVARNYLPQALALHERTRVQEPTREFVLLVRSPLLASDKQAYSQWHRTSLRRRLSGAAADAAIGFEYAFPGGCSKLKSSMPRQFGKVRTRLLGESKIRR